MIDNLFTLVFFSVVLGLIQYGEFELVKFLLIFSKIFLFGFHITFDIPASGWIFLLSLVSIVIIGQIIGAGGMARRNGFYPGITGLEFEYDRCKSVFHFNFFNFPVEYDHADFIKIRGINEKVA